MFSLFRKKNTEFDQYFPFSTDMHSHILPGIDDGSPDLETSIFLIKGLMDLGVKKSIATPHVISDLYKNNSETITHALVALQSELRNQSIDYEVAAAAEYMLDSNFFEMLENNEKLLTLQDNIILTEFSYASMPADPEKYSFAIATAGYRPVLAHPERYAYYHGNYKMYHRFVELGFMLQLNLLSFTGYYGKDAVKAAHYMLKNELVSFLGTDMHHPRHLLMLQDSRTLRDLHRNLSYRTWNNVLD